MLDYYKDKLPQARLGRLSSYGEGEAAVAAAKLNYAELFIGDQKIIVMDHGYGGEASFNEAFSLFFPSSHVGDGYLGLSDRICSSKNDWLADGY